MEGISQEAIALAGHWKLNKLIVLYDDNGISIDGDLARRFRRPGEALQVRRLGGRADRRPGSQGDCRPRSWRAQKSSKPSMIACKTTIGYGAPNKAGTAKAHGEALGADEN